MNHKSLATLLCLLLLALLPATSDAETASPITSGGALVFNP